MDICDPLLHDGERVPARFRVRNAGPKRKDGTTRIGGTLYVCCIDHVGVAVEWVNNHSNSWRRGESRKRYNRAVVEYVERVGNETTEEG